jgi:hypothetical protein
VWLVQWWSGQESRFSFDEGQEIPVMFQSGLTLGFMQPPNSLGTDGSFSGGKAAGV